MAEVENEQNHNNSQSVHHHKVQTPERVTGVLILLVVIGFCFILGFSSDYASIGTQTLPVRLNSQSVWLFYFIFTALFTVVGFGLLYSVFKYNSATSFLVSIFVVSWTVFLGPVFLKFWFNVFKSNFDGMTFSATFTNPVSYYELSLDQQKIQYDLYNLKICMINAISQLVLYLGLIGRVGTMQTVFISLFYNFIWSFNHMLCVLAQQNAPDKRLFDDYQIANVYLLAGVVGLVMTCMLKKTYNNIEYFSCNPKTQIFGMMGSFFIFMSFCLTTSFLALKNNPSVPAVNTLYVRMYMWPEAFLSCFFCLSASVMTTLCFGILIGGKVGILDCIIGTISGGIVFGSIAGIVHHINIGIVCGALAGLFSAIYYHKVYPKINGTGVKDSLGLYLIMFLSLFSTFVVAPTVIGGHQNRGDFLRPLATNGALATNLYGVITDMDAAGFALVYVGITVAVGLIGGLILGLIAKSLQRQKDYDYCDFEVFDSYDYGLKYEHEEGVQAFESAGNLRPE